jgi:hypothetical protein
MSDNNFDFDPTLVDTIDQESVDDIGPQYPIIQWHYGDQKMKKAGGMDYFGGWFIPEEHADAGAMTAAGWQATSWTHDDGSETNGFWMPKITVSVVAIRKRWEVYQATGGRQAFAWKDYDAAKLTGRPSGRTQVLVIVKDLEAQGPFVLTMKGMSAMHFEGTRNTAGALTAFSRSVLRAANMASDAAAKKNGVKGSAKRWPYRAFWLTVAAALDGQAPAFTQVGSGNNTTYVVLPVTEGVPEKPEQVKLSEHFVGKELLETVNALWAEAEETWTHAWDNLEAQGSGEASGETETAAATQEAMATTAEELGL